MVHSKRRKTHLSTLSSHSSSSFARLPQQREEKCMCQSLSKKEHKNTPLNRRIESNESNQSTPASQPAVHVASQKQAGKWRRPLLIMHTDTDHYATQEWKHVAVCGPGSGSTYSRRELGLLVSRPFHLPSTSNSTATTHSVAPAANAVPLQGGPSSSPALRVAWSNIAVGSIKRRTGRTTRSGAKHSLRSGKVTMRIIWRYKSPRT